MKKYNIFEDRGIEISGIKDETSCSIFGESSSFLRGLACSDAKTRMGFGFISKSTYNEVRVFFITITRRKYKNIFCGYDSTAFCLVRALKDLRSGTRYIVYGRLSKIKMYFIDCLEAEEINYKDLCRWLL